MQGQLRVSTPRQYLDRLAEPRRTEVAKLDAVIRKTVPQLERFICSGMLAYGPVHYRYASGREGDSARLSIASNAAAISLYALAADAKGWVVERYRDRFPKANIGKSCLRFNRFDDLDPVALKALLREAAKSPFPGHGGEAKPPEKKKPAKKAAKKTQPKRKRSERER